jgi:hypothetical protein
MTLFLEKFKVMLTKHARLLLVNKMRKYVKHILAQTMFFNTTGLTKYTKVLTDCNWLWVAIGLFILTMCNIQ